MEVRTTPIFIIYYLVLQYIIGEALPIKHLLYT